MNYKFKISSCLIVFAFNIISVISITSHAIAIIPADSIGIEKKGSKNFILHKVEKKETLYSIAKKYSATVVQLKESNADVKNGISIGQIVRIPYKLSPIKNIVVTPKTHTVAPKETLFSISKKYKVNVEELRRANPGLAAGLKTGQELNIPSKEKITTVITKAKVEIVEDKAPDVIVEKKTEVISSKIEKQEKNKDEEKFKKDLSVNKSLAISTPPAQVSSSYRKISESGLANLMENSPSDLKYLALHKNAPIGTIIQVKNDDNNQKIFVRVNGKLSNSSDKVIIKISPKAFERLGGKGDKMTVSLSYIP